MLATEARRPRLSQPGAQPSRARWLAERPIYGYAVGMNEANSRPIGRTILAGLILLIAGVFLLAGRDNVTAVSMVQGALFVLVTLEVYALAWLVFRRARVAFTVGLLLGANHLYARTGRSLHGAEVGDPMVDIEDDYLDD